MTPTPLATLKLLADDTRWTLLKTLAGSDMQLAVLAETLRMPDAQLISALKPLREVDLITERWGDATPDSVFLRTNLPLLRDLFQAAGADLHPYLIDDTIDLEVAVTRRRILFLCTHNSARSQIAETVMRTLSRGAVEVYSAGEQPGDVHPFTKQVLASMTYVEQLRAKPLSEFTGQEFDYVITVCDRAHEVCPTFPGAVKTLHWSTPDPVAVEGSNETRERAFRATVNELSNRIKYLLLLLEREQKLAALHE